MTWPEAELATNTKTDQMAKVMRLAFNCGGGYWGMSGNKKKQHVMVDSISREINRLHFMKAVKREYVLIFDDYGRN